MIRVQPSDSPAPLRQPWRTTITVGRAYDLVRADLQKHLTWVQARLGFSYCRFHALFHDDMGVVRREGDGSLSYHWHHVDQVYDFLLSIGLKPFVELNPMPTALASGSQTMFHYKMNVTPPRSYDEWGALVEAFVRHCVSRYGLAEVRSWYFEVWNEPNLGGFWSGSKKDYWRLYDASAFAVKRVDAALRIGGPATSKANWIGDFIAHCATERVPVDFVSTHLYPQDEYVEYPDRRGSPHAPGAFFTDTVREVKALVAASARPDLEIHWTEWNTQSATSTAGITWGDNVYVDNRFAAAFIARHCTALDDACDSLAYWVASDVFEEGGIPSRPFSCTYGLVTLHGLPKASFSAFALLASLRGERLTPVAPAPMPEHCGLVATREAGVTRVLAWNVRLPEDTAGTVWRDRLALTPESAVQVLSVRICAQGGSPYEHWLALGSPDDLTLSQLAFLQQRAEPVRRIEAVQVDDGVAFIDLELASNEVLLLEITPRPASTAPARADAEAWADWDRKMGETSR